jgi:hypothetical protein
MATLSAVRIEGGLLAPDLFDLLLAASCRASARPISSWRAAAA